MSDKASLKKLVARIKEGDKFLALITVISSKTGEVKHYMETQDFPAYGNHGLIASYDSLGKLIHGELEAKALDSKNDVIPAEEASER